MKLATLSLRRPATALSVVLLVAPPAYAGNGKVRVISAHSARAAVAAPSRPGVERLRILGVATAPLPDVSPSAERYRALVERDSLADRELEASGRALAPALRDAAAAPPLAIAGGATRDANALADALIAAGGAGAPSLRETIGASFDASRVFRPQELTAVERELGAADVFAGARAALRLPDGEESRLAGLADQVARWRALRAAAGEAALGEVEVLAITPEGEKDFARKTTLSQAAILRGIDDLARAVAIGRTNPAVLRVAADVVESMDAAKLRRFSELAHAFINTDVPGQSTKFARIGNSEHVAQQLIDPLAEDGAALAAAFKQNPRQSDAHFVEMLKALQYATDTGKQQNPDDLKAALAFFNPVTVKDAYIRNFILPHEYASMIWTERLGRQAGFSAREILAFQRLLANHNFGPDLARPENAAMREHWWPKNFREYALPMLQAMGIDMARYFNRDESGALQYNHALGHPYSMLLAAYDRAIAVKANGQGLATWKKYGTQDFNGKKSALAGIRAGNAKLPAGALLKPDPKGARGQDGKEGPLFEFDGPAVVKAAADAAKWAEMHVEALWLALYASMPAAGGLRRQYPSAERFRLNFGPYVSQRQAIGRMLGVLALTRASNPTAEEPEGVARADSVPKDGVAYYAADKDDALPGLYRVVLDRVGPGAHDSRSTDYRYEARLEIREQGRWGAPTGPRWGEGPGQLRTRGEDPVALLVDMIRAQKGW